jgi:prepilin-type N-terminal cleavage/methylation domain-containing protein
MIKRRSLPQCGYSLAEALVVLAIIGLISMVTIPSFMSLMRSGRMKDSLRSVTTELRYARQRAVTKREFTMVTFDTTNTGAQSHGRYTFWEGTPDPANSNDNTKATWKQIGSPMLVDVGVFFVNDATSPIPDLWDGSTWGTADTKPDILYLPDGSLTTGGTFYIRSSTPGIVTNNYQIALTSAGGFSVTGSHM